MDFTLSEEHKLLQTTVRDWAKEKLEPVADELDRKQEFAWDNFRMMAKMGLLGIGVPTEYGGSGGNAISYVVALEEIAVACASTNDIVGTHLGLCTLPIYNYGNEEQKKKYLPQLCHGEKVGAFALTEPEAGSDVASITTTAAKDGDSYILNGTKVFMTNGDVANIGVVFARVPELGARGMTAFIVEDNTPGFSKGKKYDKLGMRAATNCDFIFEDCRVPAENRLGNEGQGMRICLSTLDHGRIGMAAQACGITQAILNRATEYAKNRIQFGVPITQHQAISFRLVDVATDLQAARWLTYHAAFLADLDQRYTKEAAMAKVFASEMCMRAATFGIQVFGGYGYMYDLPMQRYFRDAKLIEIYEGTSEIQRLVISNALLR